jgi:hypothetical protein
MPSKSQRAASRQAKLRDKKHHGKAAPQTFEVGPSARALEGDEGEDEVDVKPAPRPAPAAASASQWPTRAPRMSRRAREAEATEVATYPYLGSELKRIAVIAGGIFVIIAALTFVLG